MQNQIKRRFMIVLAAVLIAAGISVLLNRASFDPSFSVVDVISGATKHSSGDTSGTDREATWNYSIEDLALPDETQYTEETIAARDGSFSVLRKTNLPDGVLVILSDKDNPDYEKAVQKAAEYYEELGYTVDIRESSETMMLSLAHAQHFDLFLLREEAGE